MGDPRKPRKKYTTPNHPWQRARIEQEAIARKEYGFANKKEIWRITTLLKKFTSEAKQLNSLDEAQSQVEREHLLAKVKKYGLIGEEASLDDVLSILPKQLMERRLQTLVAKKNLANSVNQARQFITHQHITVGGNKITSPNYLVTLEEEQGIGFAADSPFANAEHPTVQQPKKVEKKERKDERKKPTRKKARKKI